MKWHIHHGGEVMEVKGLVYRGGEIMEMKWHIHHGDEVMEIKVLVYRGGEIMDINGLGYRGLRR